MREDEWSRFVRDARADDHRSAVLNSVAPRWVTTLLLRHPLVSGLSVAAIATAATITPVSDWPYSLGFGALCGLGTAIAGLVLRRRVRRYLGQRWI